MSGMLGAPESAVAAGLPYARAVFVSGPPLCGGLVLSSLLRAQGKTLPNMAAALVGSALGAALLLLLCGRMGLGAFGAGMAMLAREAATLAVLLAYTLRHGEPIRPSLRRVRLTRAVFSEIMRSGLPTLLRQGATSVSAALLSRVSAGFGAPVLAGMGLCARAIMPFSRSAARPSAQSKRRAVRKPIASVSASRLRFLWRPVWPSSSLPRRWPPVLRRTRNLPRPRAVRSACKASPFPHRAPSF